MKNQNENELYIFGIHPCEEAILNSYNKVEKVYFNLSAKNNFSPRFKNIMKAIIAHKIPFSYIDDKRLDDYAGGANHQGVIVLMRGFEYESLDNILAKIKDDTLPHYRVNACVIILDNIEDTHNLGAIIRTAAGLGVSAVIIEKFSNAPINGTVYKTSAGQVENIPIVQVNNINVCIEKLKENGFWIYGLAANGEKNIWEERYDTPTAFVIGNEEKGISHNTQKNCDMLLKIEMKNEVESLNASVSAALAMYEWRRGL